MVRGIGCLFVLNQRRESIHHISACYQRGNKIESKSCFTDLILRYSPMDKAQCELIVYLFMALD